MEEKGRRSSEEVKVEGKLKGKKKVEKRWQKPTLEDVSEKVMAQPYIRFT